jgi:Tfp pilus assembly protein PilF
MMTLPDVTSFPGKRESIGAWTPSGAPLAGLCLLALAFALVTPSRLQGQAGRELAEGTAALYGGQFEKARTIAVKYLKAHPRDVSAHILLARVEVAEGHFQSAFEVLRQARESAPSNLDVLYYLERLCNVLSQDEFRRLLETAPNSFRTHQVLAESYLARNDRGGAEKAYQSALKANPESPEILDALGDLMRAEYKFDAALDYYERARKLSPRDFASAYGAATCYLFQHNTQRAIESLQVALGIDPDSVVSRLALGDAWMRVGRTEAGITELKAALTLAPNLRQAYTLLAQAYQKLGMAREANEALAKEQELAREEAQKAEAGNLEESRPSDAP